jgi:hypothetical protein
MYRTSSSGQTKSAISSGMAQTPELLERAAPDLRSMVWSLEQEVARGMTPSVDYNVLALGRIRARTRSGRWGPRRGRGV